MTRNGTRVVTPLTDDVIRSLKAGDEVELSGVVYTARDAAHKRMVEADKAPFDYEGQAVFYAGPCPAPMGKVIGSIGPTTSGRMDAYAPTLIAAGLKVMIGKGARSAAVVSSIKEHCGLYLAAVGGVAALMAKRVTAAAIVAYDDLGTEAVRRLVVERLPLIVAVDCLGRSIYE